MKKNDFTGGYFQGHCSWGRSLKLKKSCVQELLKQVSVTCYCAGGHRK